jgi:Phosphotransferase enzyme family
VELRAPTVTADRLASWCAEHLGSAVDVELMRTGHLAAVVGVRLRDGRDVVIKVRPHSGRLTQCVLVQQQVAAWEFPCPAPISGVLDLDGCAATVEQYVPGGTPHPDTARAAEPFAVAFARLVELAPTAAAEALRPAPAWNRWNHDEPGLWAAADDLTVNLNRVSAPVWVDRAAASARARLQARAGPVIVTHGDWYAANLRWAGDRLLVAHDWDSIIADTEAAAVGFAAAAYPAVGPGGEATIPESEDFLDAYSKARGRILDRDEEECAWAAGVWLRAFDAKKQCARRLPIVSLSSGEADERLRRAGARTRLR